MEALLFEGRNLVAPAVELMHTWAKENVNIYDNYIFSHSQDIFYFYGGTYLNALKFGITFLIRKLMIPQFIKIQLIRSTLPVTGIIAFNILNTVA